MLSEIFQTIAQDPLSFSVYLFLLFALLAWRGSAQSTLWQSFFWVSLALGVFSHRIGVWGLISIAALAALLFLHFRKAKTPFALALSAIGSIILSVVLAARLLPDVNNFRLISGLHLREDAVPYSLWLNYDKLAIGLLFLGISQARPRLQAAWKLPLRPLLAVVLGGIVLPLALAWALGYLRWDPRCSEVFLVWAPINLFFTCVGEEAIFRGLIQGSLGHAFAHKRHGQWMALGLASVLFGLAHFAGGTLYVLLATVAGVFYGWIYLQSRSLEMAALTHFALNATHFLFFTYPALANR